jgi:outer membrane protein OmpA-like peptidoglycan-associated protein/curli biogenesis system outer membrane secretion channel CsgG
MHIRPRITFGAVVALGVLGSLLLASPAVAQTYGGGGPNINQATQERYDGPKARIAVARFTNKSGKGQAAGIGTGMSDMLATALFQSGRYIVLERETLQDVIGEQDLGASGRIRGQTAAPIGQIEGAEILVTAAITEFEPGSSGAEAGLGASGQRGGGTSNLAGRLFGNVVGKLAGSFQSSHIALDMRLIDTRTSRIVAATSVKGDATDIAGLGGLAGGGLSGELSGYSKTPMEKAIRLAIQNAVQFVLAQTPAQYYRPAQQAPQQAYQQQQWAAPTQGGSQQPGFPQAGQQGFPSQQGFPQGQAGVPAPQGGFPQAQPGGFPGQGFQQQPGFPQAPQQGFPAQGQGFPQAPQGGLPQAQPGFPQQGFPQAPDAQAGFPQQGFPAPGGQPGFPQAGAPQGFPQAPAQGGFPQAQGAFPQPAQGFQQAPGGFPQAPQAGVPPQGFPAPGGQPGFPQAGGPQGFPQAGGMGAPAAPAAPPQPEMTVLKSTFLPGEKTLFFDDFTDMSPDDAPPHFKVRGAAPQLMAAGNIRQLTAKARGSLFPNLTNLPKNFTYEAEIKVDVANGRADKNLILSSKGKEILHWWLSVHQKETDLIVSLRAPYQELGRKRVAVDASQPIKLALWVQNGRMRSFVNGEKQLDFNQVDMPPIDKIEIVNAFMGNEASLGYRMVRFAESTPDFSQVISSSGRYVTYGIKFDTDSDRLKPESAPVIQSIARGLETNPNLRLLIEGHTDSVGNADHNLDLSRRRAEAVKTVLVTQFKVDPARLEAAGLGASKPIASNDTPQGRSQNRRVELVKQ